MPQPVKQIDKEPGEQLDYGAKFAKEFAKLGDGDSIASILWVLPASVQDADGYWLLDDSVATVMDTSSPSPVFDAAGTSFTADTAIVKLAGGVMGKTYPIQVRAKTAAGRRYVRRINIYITPLSH